MDEILWKFGQCYHQRWVKQNPKHGNINVGVIVMGFLLALETEGHATKTVDTNGDVTFRASEKFMVGKKTPRGPLISFGPGLQ
jgi:hypothetical protein